jgi:uncharacterized repeat protein (TIGR03803 family)
MKNYSHIQRHAAAFVAIIATLITAVNLASAQPLQPQVLVSFTNPPANPSAGLVQGPDGNFYGTTEAGGEFNWGTVFKVAPNGTLTTVTSWYLGHAGQFQRRQWGIPYGWAGVGAGWQFLRHHLQWGEQ